MTDVFSRLGLDRYISDTNPLAVSSPIDGRSLGSVQISSATEISQIITRSQTAFLTWRNIPAPRRGELVRLFGEELRINKNDLAELVTMECGKIISEGLGEVQEMIDICDFAVGLSRQLYGLTIASERPGHHMREMWHPLGPVGIISAFNFPVAVWAWNAVIAIVCGNPCVWKPSEKTPLTALAVQTLFDRAVSKFGNAPPALSQIVIGGRDAGQQLADSSDLPLISATGSCAMGRSLGPRVAQRFGRSLLELGGNNAAIVMPTSDMDLTVRAICFSAAGTAGQRCTSLRRLFLHNDVYDAFMPKLKLAYSSLVVGNPLDKNTQVGPLIDADAFEHMQTSLNLASEAGGRVEGGSRLDREGFYVRPAIVEMSKQDGVVMDETFAPILYVMKVSTLEEAIDLQNAAFQGLSSCIFTNDIREAEMFLSAVGSDCGIANVNIGPSGAEIGGAFGGEKETGGGRESGSDSWKAYMRRQTQTVNFSTELPLAQGVKFDV